MSNIVKITKAKKKSKSHAGFLGLILVTLVICFLLLSPIFAIENIEVSGNKTVTSNYIISAADALYGENILRMNKFNIIDKINALPVIEETDIKRKWPNTLVITVKERDAVAEVKFYGSKLLLSENGDVINVITDDTITNYPILEGITIKDVITGEAVKCKEEEKLKKYLEVLKKLKENDMLNEVVKLSENEGFLVHFKIGHVAFLGDIDNLQRKIEWLKGVWEKEANPAYIDLHNLDKVITKPVWGMLNDSKVITDVNTDNLTTEVDSDNVTNENGTIEEDKKVQM